MAIASHFTRASKQYFSRHISRSAVLARCATFWTKDGAHRVILPAAEQEQKGAVRARIGPSEMAAMAIGDIVSYSLKASVGQAFHLGDLMITLHWEGYHQTTGDELYHTVWSNVEGSYDYKAPFPCTVVVVNEAELSDGSIVFDDDLDPNRAWLLDVTVDSPTWAKLDLLDAPPAEDTASAGSHANLDFVAATSVAPHGDWR